MFGLATLSAQSDSNSALREEAKQGQVCNRGSKRKMVQWWGLQLSVIRGGSFGNGRGVMNVMICGMLQAFTTMGGRHNF